MPITKSIKSISNNDLDYIFETADFKIQPRRHQLISILYHLENKENRTIFPHGIGTGKTLTAIWSAQLSGVSRVLVVCPGSALAAWSRDISQYTNLSYHILDGSSKRRQNIIENTNYDFYIINYEGLKTLYAEMEKGRGWQIRYSWFVDSFDCIIFDELHRLANFDSLQHKIAMQLSVRARYVFGLTGTFIKKDNLLDIFGQVNVVDLGKSLGRNFYAFRNKYFKQRGFDWIPKRNTQGEILKKIEPIVISYSREECLDLPKQTFDRRLLKLSDV